VLRTATATATAKSGYIFAADPTTAGGLPAFDASSYAAAHTTANPVTGTGSRSFYVNETGVVYFNTVATPPTCDTTATRVVTNGTVLNN
jgi:hypothetical protein